MEFNRTENALECARKVGIENDNEEENVATVWSNEANEENAACATPKCNRGKNSIEFSPLGVTKDNRWRYKKYGVRLILRDAQRELGLSDAQLNGLFKILLARGVVTSFTNRKRICSLITLIKKTLSIINSMAQFTKNPNRAKLSGMVLAFSDVLQELKKIVAHDDWSAGSSEHDAHEVDKLLKMDFR